MLRVKIDFKKAKNPFLFFRNNLRQSEIQNNYNIIEKNIKKIIIKLIIIIEGINLSFILSF